MAKKRKYSKRGGLEKKEFLNLDPETKRGIIAIILFTLAILVFLGFNNWAGRFGNYFNEYATLLLGKGVFLFPLILIIAGLIIIKYIHKNIYLPVAIGSTIFILGSLSLIHILFSETERGGYIGYLVSQPFLYLLGKWAAFVIFIAFILISILITFNVPLKKNKEKLGYSDEIERSLKEAENISKKRLKSQGFFEKILPKPKFKVKNLNKKEKEESSSLKTAFMGSISNPPISNYKFPPIDLLGEDKGSPSSGDVRLSASIIKKTLENFNIDVEMVEVSIGPTVTQ